ncbi:transposase [Natrialba sp. INN-245]|uniref:transposase n=1 Tax=Natrialba sp. INN-245 TaxID=2690967 RepID=UPI00131237F6|nr:hypothetical protein [Natrialba sp. INN-245]
MVDCDWVEEDSLEQFVSDTTDYLDGNSRLDPFYAKYRQDGRGHPAYHPAMLLKVLVFGYANGIRSSRKLDRLLERDIAFRYLAANQQPNFRTISDFRKDHREGFEHLFTEILQLCLVSGLAELGEVALDGQRVQSDASISRNRTREQIKGEIQDILDEAAAIDAEEDDEYGPENRGDELPEELRKREHRLETLREAHAQLEAEEQRLKDEQAEKIRQRKQAEKVAGQKKRGRKPKPPEEVELPEEKKANLTDTESQTLKTRTGWVQGYNGQAAVDCESQVIFTQKMPCFAAE